MSAAIALEDVSFSRGPRAVLTHVQLQLDAAERVALLGPSGSGKSTLLRLVLGLDSPSQGTVRVSGRIASRDGRILVPPEARRLGVVFQDLALWPHLTVWGNLAFGLQARGLAKAEQEQRIRPWLDRLGLRDEQDRHPGELSGGERQRAAIARALVLRPEAVLLDEPLANLDARLKRELLTLFRDVFAEQQCTVLYVTHDLREAVVLADRIIVLEDGRVVQDATRAELLANPSTDFVRALVDDSA